ncbi:hypothetical protein FA13DRAFT_1711397 [Coprinellus micaceus]|uniref:Uncharacterized protein n=1 Tax=Coprinellus micaceus TaxID=71717 RepID=A0A4Y7T4D6_COPMI|nr:hypothetical protein FA13DRAFT_1711397 [Coprinellus micaceus]
MHIIWAELQIFLRRPASVAVASASFFHTLVTHSRLLRRVTDISVCAGLSLDIFDTIRSIAVDPHLTALVCHQPHEFVSNGLLEVVALMESGTFDVIEVPPSLSFASKYGMLKEIVWIWRDHQVLELGRWRGRLLDILAQIAS